MSINSVDITRVICPSCEQIMQYVEEDHFFRCPTCNSEFWVPDKSVPCPACGKPMKYFPEGCYRCTGCKGEYWPGKEPGLDIWRDPSAEPPEPGEELKARCYHRGQTEFKGESKGRKRKKPPKSPKAISDKYLDPYP